MQVAEAEWLEARIVEAEWLEARIVEAEWLEAGMSVKDRAARY